MYRLFLSRAAEEDFEQIVSYMTKELANPIAAEHFLDAVNDCYTNFKIYRRCMKNRAIHTCDLQAIARQ